jgi:hypothetical protein
MIKRMAIGIDHPPGSLVDHDQKEQGGNEEEAGSVQ